VEYRKRVFGWKEAIDQWKFLWYELFLLLEKRPMRWLIFLFEPSASVIISYRIDRSGYLLFGQSWTALRILLVPLNTFLALLGCRHEICWKAEVGKGLRIIHPTLGIVIHGEAVVGGNCVLIGGNSLGGRKPIRRGQLILGNDVVLGIHSCVLGPVRIGNGVQIGAGAVVIHDQEDGAVVVGMPARAIVKGKGNKEIKNETGE
jgi:serine acetyltransferase